MSKVQIRVQEAALYRIKEIYRFIVLGTKRKFPRALYSTQAKAMIAEAGYDHLSPLLDCSGGSLYSDLVCL